MVVESDGALRSRASFMVARITNGAETDLFATGVYEDRVVHAGGGWRFAERVVVLDSDRVDTLLALPL